MNYIKPLRPFYGFTQTVFPTVYDDSLSYYESINKMIYTFNQVIKDMNDNYEAIDEIFTDLVDKANEAINRAETAADAAEAAQAAAELAEAGSKAAQALAEAAQKKAEAAQAAAETAEDGAQTAETNAVAAQKAAEAAQALAEAARDAAKAAQTAAEAARDQSKNYAQQSATSAADAAESAKDAEESANNAKNYSESAASSAAAASSSASAAENSANAALAAKTAAEAAQAAAEAAQAAAETAEAGSKTAQAASEAAQKLSEAARDAAQAAQAAAETAKTAAETAATNAAASATAASQSATQAANSASAAAESASNADADATNAAESATHAANSATQAAASATDAADSAELAKEYADQAQVDIDAKLADYLPLEGGKMKGSIKGAYLEISNNQAALVGGDDVGGCTILYNFPTEGEQSRAVRLFISKSGDILNGTIGSMYVGNTFKKIYFNVEDYRAGDNFWQDNIGYDFFPNYMAIKGNRVIMNGENPLGSEGIIDVSFGGEESFSVSANELVYALDSDRSFSLNGNGFYLKHNEAEINADVIDLKSLSENEPLAGLSIDADTVSIYNSVNSLALNTDMTLSSEGTVTLESNDNQSSHPTIVISGSGIEINSVSPQSMASTIYAPLDIRASKIDITSNVPQGAIISGVRTPSRPTDAANKDYVDDLVATSGYELSEDDNFYYLYNATTSNVKIYSKTTINSTREVSGSMIGFNTYFINSYEINPPENKYPTHEMSRIINQRYFGGTSTVSAVEGGMLVIFQSSTNQIVFSWYANASSSITSITNVTAYLGVGTLLFDYIAI